MRCTGTYYALLIPLSVKVFSIFEFVQQNIFEKTVPIISVHDLLYVGTGKNFRRVTRKGRGHCILDQIQIRMFCPSILPLKMVEYSAAA
jgi:hypothetical protein